jgi:hypothetical protein
VCVWPEGRTDRQGKLDKNGRDKKRQLEDAFARLMEHRKARRPERERERERETGASTEGKREGRW